MSWNYRMMRHIHNEHTWYEIHEVYYYQDGNIRGWTKNSVAAVSDTAGDMRKVLDMMAVALIKDVLDYESGKPIDAAHEPATSEPAPWDPVRDLEEKCTTKQPPQN